MAAENNEGKGDGQLIVFISAWRKEISTKTLIAIAEMPM